MEEDEVRITIRMAPADVPPVLAAHCENRPNNGGLRCWRCWICTLLTGMVGREEAERLSLAIRADLHLERARLLAANEARLLPRAKPNGGGNGANGGGHFILPPLAYEAEHDESPFA